MRELAYTTVLLLAAAWGPSSALASEPAPQLAYAPAPSPVGASLPELSPDIIAADITRTRVEGRTTLRAPDFDPFETETELAGRASLVSDEGLSVRGVDRDGAPMGAGAVLEIAMVYAMESRDPYEVRGYRNAGYLNGSRARVIGYDPRVLECSTRVSEAGEYPDNYYRGDSHGSVMGMYARYPRYRGHRDFGFGIERRRPYWDTRYGYDYGYGYDPYVGGPYQPGYERRRDRRRDVLRRDRGVTGVSGGGRRGGVGLDRTFGDGGVVADPAPRRTRRSSEGGTRTGTGRGRIGGVLADEDPRRTTREPVAVPDTGRPIARGPASRGPTTRGRRSVPQRPVIRDPGRRAPREGLAYEPPLDAGNRDAGNGVTGNRGANTRSDRNDPKTTRRLPSRREIKRDMAREGARDAVRGGSTRSQSRSEPRTQTRSQPKSQPRSQPRSEPRSQPRRQERSRPQRVDRRTDREFSRPSRSNRPTARPDARPQLNWQAGYVERPAGLCAKEETLTLFIPAQRLEAARYDGLTVLVEDEFGRELPVFVPPNYVEGFLIANGRG